MNTLFAASVPIVAQETDEGTFGIWASAFDRPDDQGRRLAPGAFAAAVAASANGVRLPICWNHPFYKPLEGSNDPLDILARADVVEEVAAGDDRLPEQFRPFGSLWLAGRWFSTPKAQHVRQLVQERTVGEASIGAFFASDAFDDLDRITAVDLFEVSFTLRGAMPGTEVMAASASVDVDAIADRAATKALKELDRRVQLDRWKTQAAAAGITPPNGDNPKGNSNG
ncbi:MAG: HK97 family phage prohead protease [Acidimicrobiia bacterium]|nr:HK97 family phage prohead protease [Acidimicrobiia bacterium]